MRTINPDPVGSERIKAPQRRAKSFSAAYFVGDKPGPQEIRRDNFGRCAVHVDAAGGDLFRCVSSEQCLLLLVV